MPFEKLLSPWSLGASSGSEGMLCCSMDLGSVWVPHKHLLAQSAGLSSGPQEGRPQVEEQMPSVQWGFVAGCLGTWSSSAAPPHSPLPPAAPPHRTGTEASPLLGCSCRLLARAPRAVAAWGPGSAQYRPPRTLRRGLQGSLSDMGERQAPRAASWALVGRPP